MMPMRKSINFVNHIPNYFRNFQIADGKKFSKLKKFYCIFQSFQIKANLEKFSAIKIK